MKNKLILAIILSIGILLRFVWLGTVPVNLTLDEVNNGYTAYSLLKTGKDEWGQRLPMIFRSVGDFKPPVLIYLTVPSVAIFGLNEFATRFPVALFSFLTIIVAYLLSRDHLFKRSPQWVHYFNAGLFAVSPWLLIYSRSGYEAVIALCFFLLNLYFLLGFFDKLKSSRLFLALLFAFLSAYTYHSFKLSVPLMDLFVILLNLPHLKKITSQIKKEKIAYGLIFIFFVICTFIFIRFFIFGPGATRAKMVFLSIDFDFNVGLMAKLRMLSLGVLQLPLLLFFWFKRFLDYFTPNFYLYSGLELTTIGHTGVGVTGLALYLLFIFGLIKLLFFKDRYITSKTAVLLFAWLLIGFLPASLANNIQQPLRSLGALPAVLFISSFGCLGLLELGNKVSTKKIIWAVFILLFVFYYLRFLDYYLVHYPQELSEYRQYGWEQMAKFVFPIKDQYDNVFVDPRYGSLGRTTYSVPYLYFLFYSHYDPASFQRQTASSGYNSNFDNFRFGDIDVSQLKTPGNNLYVASPWSFPDYFFTQKTVLYEVKFLNGTPALYAISNKDLKK